MAYLVIKHGGSPFLVLEGASLSELGAHIRNGYPEWVDEYMDGTITGEVVDAPPVLSPPPATERIIMGRLIQAKPFLEYLFDLENRVRVLEGKQAITKQIFIDAVKDRLGL